MFKPLAAEVGSNGQNLVSSESGHAVYLIKGNEMKINMRAIPLPYTHPFWLKGQILNFCRKVYFY